MADQKRTALDWEDIRIFVALARHGSLSATARALSVNHATIARRIQALEGAMGEKLVERRPDGYVLTPAGTRALGPSSDMEAAASALSRGGTDDQPRGLVRVNSPPSLSQAFLAVHLAKLTIQFPSLDIDVASDVRNVSLERRETDIALRYGKPQDGDVIAKRLSTIGFGFYAAPGYESHARNSETPSFVGFDEMNAYLPEAVWLSRQFPQARIAFRASNQIAQAAAASAGAGVALLPHFVGRTIADLRLIQLGDDPPSRELWLITRRRDRKDASVRAIADFLVELFLEQRTLFEDPIDLKAINGS